MASPASISTTFPVSVPVPGRTQIIRALPDGTVSLTAFRGGVSMTISASGSGVIRSSSSLTSTSPISTPTVVSINAIARGTSLQTARKGRTHWDAVPGRATIAS